MIIRETYYDGTAATGVGEKIRTRFALEINPATIKGFQYPGVIKNFSEYMVHFNTLRGKKGGHYKSKNRLDNFRKGLKEEFNGQEVDPIEYLIYLYYQCGLSLDDICIRVDKLGFDYKDATGLRMFVTKTLLWTLRENTEKTEQRIRKEKTTGRAKREHSLREHNKPRIEEQTKEISDAIDLVVRSREKGENESFDISEYEKLSNNTKKTLYLLKTSLGITPEDITYLFETINNQNIICAVINTKLAVIFTQLGLNPFPIYARTISEIKKQSL